jgi:hypothetical protein
VGLSAALGHAGIASPPSAPDPKGGRPRPAWRERHGGDCLCVVRARKGQRDSRPRGASVRRGKSSQRPISQFPRIAPAPTWFESPGWFPGGGRGLKGRAEVAGMGESDRTRCGTGFVLRAHCTRGLTGRYPDDRPRGRWTLGGRGMRPRRVGPVSLLDQDRLGHRRRRGRRGGLHVCLRGAGEHGQGARIFGGE